MNVYTPEHLPMKQVLSTDEILIALSTSRVEKKAKANSSTSIGHLNRNLNTHLYYSYNSGKFLVEKLEIQSWLSITRRPLFAVFVFLQRPSYETRIGFSNVSKCLARIEQKREAYTL